MADALQKICADKRDHVEACKAEVTLAELETRVQTATAPRGFATALQNAAQNGYGLISEIKKASPSKGLIRDDFDPPSLARAYESGGATCLSVLTDIPYFQGADEHLIAARNAASLPVLRKDFMIDPYQIIEARALGADCILLIMAALDDDLAADMEQTAMSLGMDVLVEIHNEEELERALRLKSPLMGVNNRNLKTLKTDTATTIRLASMIPPDRTLVCESGLKTQVDLASMAEAGARCFLIGEALMLQDDVAEAVRTILSDPVLPSAAEEAHL